MLTTQGRLTLAEAGFWVDKEGNVWRICELSDEHIKTLQSFLHDHRHKTKTLADLYSIILEEYSYRASKPRETCYDEWENMFPF